MTSISAAVATEIDISNAGYFRHGVIYEIDDHEYNRCLQAEDSYAKSRFGNECEGFLEFQISGVWESNQWHGEIVLGWDAIHISGETPKVLYQDESFLQISRREWRDTSVWLGKRTYKRHEIHLLDYKSFHLKGYGFGLAGKETPLGQLSIAYFHNNEFAENIAAADVQLETEIFKRDLKTLTLTSIASYAEPIKHSDFSSYGRQLGAILDYRISSLISSKLTMKRSSGSFVLHENPTKNNSTPHAEGWLASWETVFEQSSSSIGTVLLYEERQLTKGIRRQWLSAGARYQYYHGDHLSTVFDIAADQTNSEGLNNLLKVSVALQYSKIREFYGRPAIRFFVTNFSSDEREYKLKQINIGIQYETWW